MQAPACVTIPGTPAVTEASGTAVFSRLTAPAPGFPIGSVSIKNLNINHPDVAGLKVRNNPYHVPLHVCMEPLGFAPPAPCHHHTWTQLSTWMFPHALTVLQRALPVNVWPHIPNCTHFLTCLAALGALTTPIIRRLPY